MPTKYRSEPRKPWKTVTTVRSLYMPELPSYKTEFRYGTGSYSRGLQSRQPYSKGQLSYLWRRPWWPTTNNDWWPTINADLTTAGMFQAKNQKKTDGALVSMKVICLQYLQKVAVLKTSIIK